MILSSGAAGLTSFLGRTKLGMGLDHATRARALREVSRLERSRLDQAPQVLSTSANRSAAAGGSGNAGRCGTRSC